MAGNIVTIFKTRTMSKLLATTLTIYLIALASLHSQISENDFVTTWKTDNPGSDQFGPTTILIPTFLSGYDYDIDWNNDGVFDEFGKTGNALHDYGAAGTYTVRIRGTFPQIYINDDLVAKNKIISVEQWGNISWRSMNSAFRGAKNLVINATDAPNLSNASSLYAMFYKASSFNQNINHWDVSNIKIMDFLFAEASSYNQPLDNWNMSNVTSMKGMFEYSIFNQNINGWNVSEVQNISYMFYFAEEFNQPLNSWDVAQVVDMEKMFLEANTFNQSLNNWNVGNVTNMQGMFDHADVFNQPLNDWNVSSVVNMERMFDNTDSFDQLLNNWDIKNVTNMKNMFRGIQLSTDNYDDILIAWSDLSLQNDVEFSGGNSAYCNGQTARNNLINTFGWTINDGGLDCSGLNISEFSMDAINIYPNPFNNFITINAVNSPIKSVELFSFTGQLISKHELFDKIINLSHLSSGVYFLKMIGDKGSATKKIIKS